MRAERREADNKAEGTSYTRPVLVPLNGGRGACRRQAEARARAAGAPVGGAVCESDARDDAHDDAAEQRQGIG